MRRTIIILLTLCSAVPVFASDYFLRIQSEYRRDAVDFEDDTREFYRQKLKIRFSEKSEANAAFVYDAHANSSHYTWNIFLRDISPYFAFFAGNFYAHFGKGMLLGKRSVFQADVFERQGEIFSGESITPATSGNPYFAFNGCGFMLQFALSELIVRTLAFYSRKERYISQQDFESRSTLSSVWSLEKYEDRTGCRIEPADMHTAGACMSVLLYRLFLLDIYGVRNQAQTPFDDDIALRDGVLHFKGFGFTAQYRDEFITLFTEISSSSTTYRNEDSTETESSASALLSGFTLRSAHFNASFAYKTVEADYFSPYTATIGEYLGPGMFLDARYTPFEKLVLGACFSSERKSAPSSTDKDVPTLQRERFFCEYSQSVLHSMRIEYARAHHSSDDVQRRRYRGSIALGNTSFILFSASGTYQKKEYAPSSYCTTTALSLFFHHTLSVHASWTRGWIGEGNPVYEYLLPQKNTNIPGTFLRESGNTYALKFVFHRWGLYFSCRGICALPEEGRRTTLLEAFASGQF